MVYDAQGRWAEAERAYHQSLTIKREFEDRHGEGQTLQALGGVYYSQARWTEADQTYHRSLAIYREFRNRHGEGETLSNLALLKEAQGDFPDALVFARQAVAVLEQTEAKSDLQEAGGILKRLEARSEGGVIKRALRKGVSMLLGKRSRE